MAAIDMVLSRTLTNKQKVAFFIAVIGFMVGEIGNSFLTYDWYGCKAIVFRHWEDQTYTYAEFADNIGDIVLKLFFVFGLRLCAEIRPLKISCNFYIEYLLTEAFYATFFNPFVYHLSKVNLMLLALGFYSVQYFSWIFIPVYKKATIVFYIWISGNINRFIQIFKIKKNKS